jgi:hypothetical protein
LLLIYELLLLIVNNGPDSQLRNAADWLVRGAIAPLGVRGAVGVSVALIAVGAVLVASEWRAGRPPIRGRYFGGMVAESFLLAVLFGSLVSWLTALALSPLPLAAAGQAERLGTASQLALAFGAGVYEELVFRVFLVSGITWLVTRAREALGRDPGSGRPALLVAVFGSAVLFSAVHYAGPYGDALEIWSFSFRFVAGLAFSVLYAVRGYGITAWTHTLYDLLVVAGVP